MEGLLCIGKESIIEKLSSVSTEKLVQKCLKLLKYFVSLIPSGTSLNLKIEPSLVAKMR